MDVGRWVLGGVTAAAFGVGACTPTPDYLFVDPRAQPVRVELRKNFGTWSKRYAPVPITSRWHFHGIFSSMDKGVCPNSSRNLLEGAFLRLRISPQSITTSCSYVLPSITAIRRSAAAIRAERPSSRFPKSSRGRPLRSAAGSRRLELRRRQTIRVRADRLLDAFDVGRELHRQIRCRRPHACQFAHVIGGFLLGEL